MKILKRILIVFTLLILVIGGCIYYAFKIEPYRVTLNEFTLNEEKPDREHLKIVQISDLHIKEMCIRDRCRGAAGRLFCHVFS